MVDTVVAQWKAAGFWKKFILVNIAIPWTPIIMLALAYFAPPEVVDLVTKNGKLVGEVVGTSWELTGYFFSKAVGL